MIGTEQRQRVDQAAIEHITDVTFSVGEQQLQYRDFYNAFAESAFGQHQATQRLRYHKKYPYDPERFLEDLGDDVHPVRHMAYTHDEIVVPLLRKQVESATEKPSQEDITNIRLAALIHDIGECEYSDIADELGYVVGDVLFHQKTSQDTAKEKSVRSLILRKIREPYDQLPLERAEELELIIDNKRPGNFADKTFNICEHLGYYETGIRAGAVILSECKDLHTITTDERLFRLGALATQVSMEWRPILSEHQETYLYVQERLDETADIYDQIATEIAPILAKQ